MMTNRMIDADALLEQIEIEKNNCPFIDSNSKRGWGCALMNIEQHIGLMITPEPQESIFDADGWSKDFSIMPKDTWVQITFNNCVKAIAKFDKNLNIICTDWCDVDKIKTINKWRPLPTLPTGDNE
jgi:hypothetical protein